MTIKSVLKLLIGAILVLSIVGCSDNDEDTKKQEVPKRNISLNQVDVSDYQFTMNNQDAVSITLLQDNSNYFTITINKSKIQKGFKFLRNKDNYNTVNKDVDISATFTNDNFNFLPNVNDNSFIELEVIDYDKINKKAIIKVSTTVVNTNNPKDTIGFNGAELTFTNSDSKAYFDLLTKNFNSKKTIDNSITSKNIQNVIKSLKENYDISAVGFNNSKLIQKDICLNENFCEVYADKVQIQAVSKNIEALTSSKVTPLYYQQVCSAIMIGLTDANREIIEQQIPEYFNYASKNGKSKWKALGVEITIAPDSQNLLGCSFYKQ
jgi:hypothetical protein